MSTSRYSAISPWTILAAAASWILTIAVTYNLLGGTFDERSCQTGCVQTLATASFVVAVIGILFGHRHPRHPVTLLALLAMIALAGIYLTVLFVGVLLG